MSETQDTMGRWADATFPGPDRETGARAQAVKLLQEATELAMACGASGYEVAEIVTDAAYKIHCETGVEYVGRLPFDEAKVAKESADCNVVNSILAHRVGFDLASETDSVMARNRKRAWKVSPEGMAQHVGEDVS